MIQEEQRKKIFDALALSTESHKCSNCHWGFTREDKFGVQGWGVKSGVLNIIYIICSVCGIITWISAESLGLREEDL